MTPEAKVKQQVKKLLDELDIYYFAPAANGYGRAGIPDLIACCRGRYVAIECKAGKGTTTALQDQELARITEAGGVTYVAREDNLEALKEILTCLNQ